MSSKHDFAASVFIVALSIVIDDVIDNGVQFQFSHSRKGDSYICVDLIDGETFIKIKKLGGLKGVDPLKSNFCAYKLRYKNDDWNHITVWWKEIVLDPARRKRLVDMANSRSLKIGKVKTYKDYYDTVQARYPYLDRYDIYRILRFGFDTIKRHIEYGGDVRVHNRNFRMYIGSLSKDNKWTWEYVWPKLLIKERVLYRKLCFIPDGYGWFSLSEERYNKAKKALENHELYNFGRVRVHTSYDDAFLCGKGCRAIIRIPHEELPNRFYKMERVKTDKAEVWDLINSWKDINMILPCSRKYQVLGKDKDIFALYNKNKGPYISHRRAKRYKELGK